MPSSTVVVTGVGLALPGVATPADLVRGRPGSDAPAVDPGARIGTKGLRYKDRATRLALCAAQDALVGAELLDDGAIGTGRGPLGADALRVPGESVAVVVSSNLGNLDTVCETTSIIAERTVTGTSPMDLPNASSNVPASSVAIRFGLRGPNLMLCNGATSGLDAVHWAAVLVAGGRADHAVVVGVEPRNTVVERLVSGEADDLLDGAVALVVETAGRARLRGAEGVLALGRYARTAYLADCLARVAGVDEDAPGLWFVPERYDGASPHPWVAETTRRDVSAGFGRGSGATGVLQCATAAACVRAGHAGPVVVTAGADGEAMAGMVLRDPSASPDPQPPVGTRTRNGGDPGCERLPGASGSGGAPVRSVHGGAEPRPSGKAAPHEQPVAVRLGRAALAGPPLRVLLLHGLASNGMLWNPYLDRADERAELWVADLPWRGDGVVGWTEGPDVAHWIATALAAVPGGADVVMAHSFAANALLGWLDRKAPDGVGRPRGFVFVSPMFRRHTRDFDWASITFYLNNFDRILAEGIHLRAAGRLAPDITHEMALHVRERVGPYGWMRFFGEYLRTPHVRTDHITDPCLIIGGERDFAAPPSDAHALVDALPDASARLLPDCGHFAMHERPDAFAAAANAHLEVVLSQRAAAAGTSVPGRQTGACDLFDHDFWERNG